MNRPTHRIRSRGARTVIQAVFASALSMIALLAPSASHAQSPVSPGTLSISFGLESAPEAGIWFTATTHTRVGLLGTLDRTSTRMEGPGEASSSTSRLRYTVGPAVKWYLLTGAERVAPFWYAAGVVGGDDPPGDRRTTSFGIDGGFGVDWFPVPQVSFGGFTGLGFEYDRVREGEVTTTSSRLGTVTAGLRMHVYF